ncbi:MAG TPA: precorrin-2 C(20)-methyltransferase [Ideonella sp.]|uniref:precorrin-2 C(20)-methyltransferase n=1 Tax=Ideonella sp. TaxID=1929293 RepID=UPI002B61422D|nr:precorrin-2 C(20)-methyltransferase [Ideonella sp.]HSI50610.1 precorrin-2 C(20)-methyltransferase [Ideonella sp.]
MTGTLFGVSLGPGDPELMTRRAFALLQRPDAVWTWPIRSGKSESYALAIASRAGLTPPAASAGESQALLFPMTHDGEKLGRAWLRAAQTVLPLLQAGRDVLFLVEGDASTYATFGHLAQTVKAMAPEVAVEIVPGVPSFIASCAELGQPLAEQDDTVAIVPAAYGVDLVERLLDDFDTLVLMKVKPLLDELIALFERRGLLDRVCFVEKAGAPEERVVRDITTLRGEKVNYLSLLIVQNPLRQRGERIKGCKKKTPAATAQPAEADTEEMADD